MGGNPGVYVRATESLPTSLTLDFRTIWIRGNEESVSTRFPAARFPATGTFLTIDSIPETDKTASWMQGQRSFCFREADSAIWALIQPGTEVTTFARWIDSHLTVQSIDLGTRTVTFLLPSTTQLSAGDLYYIESNSSPLSFAPGFWKDSDLRQIYIAVNDPKSAPSMIVPRLSTLIDIRGTASAPIANLHFQQH